LQAALASAATFAIGAGMPILTIAELIEWRKRG